MENQTGQQIVAKIDRVLNIKSTWVCWKKVANRHCMKKLSWPDGKASCPVHRLEARPKKRWYTTLLCNVMEEETLILTFGPAFTHILMRASYTLKSLEDEVRGLQGKAYGDRIVRFKKWLEDHLEGKEVRFIGEYVQHRGARDHFTFFRATRTMTREEAKEQKSISEFVKTELPLFEKIVKRLFSEYRFTMKPNGICLEKTIMDDVIKIHVQVPRGKKNKIYHLWFQVNDTCFLPLVSAKSRSFEQEIQRWTYRILPGDGWKKSLVDRLTYFLKMEPQILHLVSKLRETMDIDGTVLLDQINLTSSRRDKILKKWYRKNLFDLANLVAQYSMGRAFQLIQTGIAGAYSKEYGEWLLLDVKIPKGDLKEAIADK